MQPSRALAHIIVFMFSDLVKRIKNGGARFRQPRPKNYWPILTVCVIGLSQSATPIVTDAELPTRPLIVASIL